MFSHCFLLLFTVPCSYQICFEMITCINIDFYLKQIDGYKYRAFVYAYIALIKSETDRKMNQWWKLRYCSGFDIVFVLCFKVVYSPVTMSIHLDTISYFSTKTTKILHFFIAAWFMKYILKSYEVARKNRHYVWNIIIFDRLIDFYHEEIVSLVQDKTHYFFQFQPDFHCRQCN